MTFDLSGFRIWSCTRTCIKGLRYCETRFPKIIVERSIKCPVGDIESRYGIWRVLQLFGPRYRRSWWERLFAAGAESRQVWKLPIVSCIFIVDRVDGYRFFTKGSKEKFHHGSIWRFVLYYRQDHVGCCWHCVWVTLAGDVGCSHEGRQNTQYSDWYLHDKVFWFTGRMLENYGSHGCESCSW